MKEKKDIYSNMPWTSLDDYFRLAKQHKLFGADLAEYLKKERKKQVNLIPKFRIKK